MGDPLQELNRRLDRKVQQLEALIEFGRVLAGIVDPADVARRLGLTLAGQWALRSWAVVGIRDGRAPLVQHRGFRPLDAVEDWNAVRAAIPEQAARIGENDALRTIVGENAAAVVPLKSGETTIGFVLLGVRAGGGAFDEDDLLHASGLCGQAVVALESAWQSQETSHWRLVSDAGVEWRQLDRLSRLVFVAVARLGYERAQTGEELVRSLIDSVTQPGFEIHADRVFAALERLVRAGAVSRSEEGALRIEKEIWLALPETRKPLAEIARESTERVGAYEIVERLGAGGMGEVFKGLNVHDGSPAAVKLLAPGCGADVETRRRLEREGAIVASLSHPNIVRLLERGEHEGRIYLAMELVEGQTLSSFMRRETLSPAAALRHGRDIAAALAALHERGVIHRDVKPSNLIRRPDGTTVLLDFGLARAADSTTVTAQEQIMGTLPYMSPEQLRGHAVDARADVWAFGVLLYEMLLGTLPWSARDTVRLAVEILSEPLSVEPLRITAGDGVASLVADALAPLEERIADGSGLLRRIDALVDHVPDPAVRKVLPSNEPQAHTIDTVRIARGEG